MQRIYCRIFGVVNMFKDCVFENKIIIDGTDGFIQRANLL